MIDRLPAKRAVVAVWVAGLVIVGARKVSIIAGALLAVAALMAADNLLLICRDAMTV